MLESGISRALVAVSPLLPSSTSGHELLASSLDVFSALLRPPASSADDIADPPTELAPIFKRVNAAAFECACTALAAAKYGNEGRGIRRAANTLLAQLALFPASHPDILVTISLKDVISQALIGATYFYPRYNPIAPSARGAPMKG